MIRDATENEALLIMNSKGVTERLGRKFSRLNTDRFNFSIVNERMLVGYEGDGEDVYFHPCQPKENWPFIHEDIECLKQAFLDMGYKRIITNIGDDFKKTQNLARKHGFKETILTEYERVFLWQHGY